MEKQATGVINDNPPKAVKTGTSFYIRADLGMLANEEHISVVANMLVMNSIPSVVDPVCASSR